MKLSRILGVVCSFFFILFFSVCGWSATPPTVTLFVDATSAPRKIFHAKLKIPASAGDFTLYYPKWIPGEHAPDGPLIDLAGLKFTASGKTLKWRRDFLDGFTLHVEVPAGETEVNAELDFLSPATFEGGFSAGSSATDKMAVISWNQVLLYPKGWKSDDLTYVASLKLPANWKFGTPLPTASTAAENGETKITFQPASLTTLVDSPVITGEFLKVVKLADDPPTEMDIAADSAAALAPPQEVWDHYKNLVEQANKLFGAHHYRDYHFLLSLSDHVAHFGLEHHESDDSRIEERGLVDDTARKMSAGLLPHEYVHTWNGKYRRPADLTTPDYQQPMQDDLLWVYEGLTQYLRSADRPQQSTDARAGARQSGPDCRCARPYSRPRLAQLAGYGRCRSATLFLASGLALLAAWCRFLRRRFAELAVGRRHHPPAKQRQKNVGRFLPPLPRRSQHGADGEDLYLR